LLAFPVFAAAAFFVWVLAQQTGSGGLAVVLTGLIILALTAYVWEWAKAAAKGRLKVLSAILLALSMGLLPTLDGSAPAVSAAGSYGGLHAVAFDPADIERRRAAGETIFVDYTAAWCVTCQVNKMTVLSSPGVLNAFKENSVTLVTADWTRRDPEIERSLASFGANGVPLYVVYRNGDAPVVLAQPLTENAIISAVGR
jgi:thiol:disulfide interchange protein DsbD